MPPFKGREYRPPSLDAGVATSRCKNIWGRMGIGMTVSGKYILLSAQRLSSYALPPGKPCDMDNIMDTVL